jgi:UDP-N-acetylenolpyruvoylglucosamine reductase
VELSYGSGVVTGISANVVNVTVADGSNNMLILGACSNVLVRNGGVPKVGTNVFWTGFKMTSNTHQVYSALFV